MADDAPKVNERANDAQNYWLSEGYSPGGVVSKVDYAAASKGLNPLFEGIKIVDCDTHFTEPPELFTSRAPAALKDKVPHARQVNGVDFWFVGDRNFGAVASGNVIAKNNDKLLGRLAYPTLDEGHAGSYRVKDRLQAMDDMGVYAHVMYQNSGVTQAGSLMSLNDPQLALTVIQIFNEAASDRQVESNQRLFSLASLPYWDKATMDKEARRCVEDLKLKGFVLPDRPDRLGLPGFGDPYWADFFELCSATKTPINFHLSSGVDGVASAWPEFSFEQKLAIMAMVVSINNCSTMGNFMVSGILDRYPGLNIGLIESGMGWIPFAIEALEHQFKEMMPNGSKKLERTPWEYFRDQFWCTYWFETSGPQDLLERVGVNKVLFETDYPHPTSLYPGVQDHLVKTLGGYDYEIRKRVLERNAAELYNLPF